MQYLAFVLAAQEPDGRFHNRRRSDLSWPDTASVEDCWGRALWGLGTAVARTPRLRDRALAGFDRGARLRSPHRRAMAFAALGAAEVLAALPDHVGAQALLAAAVDVIGRPALAGGWPWPEARLSYANAALPEALLVAGRALGSPTLVADGLGLLDWLLDRQTRDGHLSVVPAGGWGPGDTGPGIRPAADRGGGIGRRVRERLCRSRDDGGGLTGSSSPRRGSSGTTTPARRCTTRRPAAATTVWSASGATRTRARSPLWRCYRRSSRRAGARRARWRTSGDGVRHADGRDPDRGSGARAGAAVRARSRALPRWPVPGLRGAVEDPRAARRRGRNDPGTGL